MPITTGYQQLQPRFILGTGQWVSMAAEQMVGADFDRANQLRDHFPFFPIGQSDMVVIPRVQTLGTASFPPRESANTDSSTTTLREPPEMVEMASIEGSFNLTNYPVAVQSFSIDQLELQMEFKKIAIRITFWDQFFRPQQPNGFRGLPDLVDPSQSRAADGLLTLEDLDRLSERVTEADSEMDRKVLVMNNTTFVEFVRLVRRTGSPMTYTNFNGRRYATHNIGSAGTAASCSDTPGAWPD